MPAPTRAAKDMTDDDWRALSFEASQTFSPSAPAHFMQSAIAAARERGAQISN